MALRRCDGCGSQGEGSGRATCWHATSTCEVWRPTSAGLARVKDDAPRFPMLLLRGEVLARKGDGVASLRAYEEAKQACGACGEPGQPIVYFRLGASYASQSPPRKSEAMANLQSFQRLICKGAGAARYGDECTQTQALAAVVGGALR